MQEEILDNVHLTPPKIVAELDRFIVGQEQAKKAVAIALRNRMRRKAVPKELRDEIVPKNILMIGPTGVGKTEIARRLAKLSEAPFIKVEATKFTEVGYVGRDVDSIIRDLADIAVNFLKNKSVEEVAKKAKENAIEKVLEVLVGATAGTETVQTFRKKLLAGKLDETEIEIKVSESSLSQVPSFDIPGMPGSQVGVINVSDMLGKAFGMGEKSKLRKLSVKDALKLLTSEESEKLIDNEKIVTSAIKLVEDGGIVFLDEIDKITSRSESKSGEVSREGVQRDLLPLIEGTSVSTKYGTIKTDHILFIASGAFHLSKPSDLLPELQGRLPIRVELKDLGKEEMVRILKEPETSLIVQYKALMKTENVELVFTDEAIDEIASLATHVNREIENIGARRLHTILEKLLEDISFNAASLGGSSINIDLDYVKKYLSELAKQPDLSKFIL